MSARFLRLSIAFLALGAVAAWWAAGSHSHPGEPIVDLRVTRIEPAPLCPWREPDEDLRAWFPGADGYCTETRILSGQRLALAQRLGRPPAADENALQIHRVRQGSGWSGAVLTRRVKGESGAIEISLGVTEEGQVCGLRLQRIREPQSVRDQLERTEWLGAFKGTVLTGDCAYRPMTPELMPDAQASAASIVDGVRSLLVLYATARETPDSLIRHKS